MRGWHGNRQKHSLASRGIRSKTQLFAMGVGKIDYEDMTPEERLEYLEEIADKWLNIFGDYYNEVNPDRTEYVENIEEFVASVKDGFGGDLLESEKEQIDEGKMPVTFVKERRGGMVKDGKIWLVDTQPLKWGSVAWQDAMMENVVRKTLANIELNYQDITFLEMEAEENIRALKRKKEAGVELSEFEKIVLKRWELNQL